MASIVIAPSSNNIEQEVLLLLADEYRPTCAISMTNPGSLTMGFSRADPRHGWRSFSLRLNLRDGDSLCCRFDGEDTLTFHAFDDGGNRLDLSFVCFSRAFIFG